MSRAVLVASARVVGTVVFGLCRATLKRLMAPYLAEHDSSWVFHGDSQQRPLSYAAARSICAHAARLSRLTKSITIYTIRHSAAVHLLELGVDVRTIQKFLGHDRLSTTMRYMLFSYGNEQRLVHPLDLLPEQEPTPDDRCASG